MAQILLYHEGKPLSLKDFPFVRALYDCRAPEMVMKAGRQVTKSTTQRNQLITDAALIDNFKALYIVPLKEQASRFSNFYLKRGLRDSPILKQWRTDTSRVDKIFAKELTNGSVIQLSYSGDNADRARGIPSDQILYDEVQDILWDCIPIINESLSYSPYKWRVYSGTPKTMDGTLEALWLRSSQHEWIMQCSHCKKYNVPIEEYIYKMIEPQGLSCCFCKKLLNCRNGFWQPLRPDVSEDFLGFHIPQIIVPRNVEYNPRDPYDKPPNAPRAWKEILKKYETYPPGTFANEVLGFSHDLGGRIITIHELKECCQLPSFKEITPDWLHGCTHICAGVDWGISAETSFTVVVVGGITSTGRIKILEVKKYYGTDTVEQTKDVARICHKWNVGFVGADFGVGYTNNILLRQILGFDRILEFNYTTSTHVLKWNGARFSLDRTHSLNLLFIDMKRKFILFPPYHEMEPYFPDILSIYEHIIEGPTRTKKVFQKNPNVPDDFTHALNFLTIALRKVAGDPVINMKTGEQLYDELNIESIN